MEISLDFHALTVIVFGIAAGAFVKGLTGVGLPLVATPFLAGFLGAEHAVAVMQIPGLVSNGWLVWSTRHAAREMAPRYDMMIPAVLMIVFGVLFLSMAENRTVLLFLAGTVGIFLVLLLVNPAFRLAGRTGRAVTVGASLCGGFAQGATGVSGPLFSTLIFSFRPGKEAFVFHNALLFGTFHLFQTGLMIAFGLLTWPRVAESLLVLVPMVAFLYVGMRARAVVSFRVFNVVVFVMIVLMEIKLLQQGFDW